MPLTTKTEYEFVNMACAAWAAELGLSPILLPGDPALALFESFATQAAFLQAQAVAVNKFARASTAEGEDLDSWMADWDFARLPAVKPSGVAVFGRKVVSTSDTLVPLGKRVQTPGGAIIYEVIADTALASYSADKQAYILVPGQTTVQARVAAVTGGVAYNVQIGQLSQIADTIVGIDTVTNLAAFTNGSDAESDAKYRARFIKYINSLSKAIKDALESTIENQQQGLNYNLFENQDVNGNALLANFVAVVDDGSGNAPQTLIDKIQAALEVTRGFTISCQTIRPTLSNVTVALNIKVRPGANSSTVQLAVRDALVNHINSLKIGDTLYLYKLAQVAIDADPTNVLGIQENSLLVNGSELSLVPANGKYVYRTTANGVAVGTY